MSKCVNCIKEITDKEAFCLTCHEEVVQIAKKQIADLEVKLAESESKVAVGRFWHSAYEGKQLDYDKLNNDYNKQEKLLSEVLANKSKLQFEFDQLKQQLAEKDKEIENLNNRILISQLQAPKEQILNILGSQCIQYNPYQDKISFAVEQLEKVKEDENLYEMIFEYMNNQGVKINGFEYWCLLDVPKSKMEYNGEFEVEVKNVFKSMFDTYFDNIISELTHQHEDKGE